MASTIDLSLLRSRAVLKRITAITLTCAVLGALYAMVAPKWYQAVVTVVPAKQQKGSGLSSLLGAELTGLAAGLDVAGGSGADAPRIAAVLQSTVVTDAVIARFDLRTRYRDRYQEAARESLWRHCEVKVLSKPNLVQLACEDKDPRFVQQMLSYFAELGNQVFRRVGVSSASEEVRFLERRVADLRREADDAASRMLAFQEKHQVVDLETQSRAVVSALAALNAQRISKQLELEFARSFATQDEAVTRQLQSQLSIMDRAFRDLEEASTASPALAPNRRETRSTKGVFPAALDVPKLRSEYEQLFRDRKVSEASLVFALERLESAKANEARDVSTFVTLDPPTVPTRHSRPKRFLVLVAATLLGLAASTFVEWWRSLPRLGRAPADGTSRGQDRASLSEGA